MNEFNNIFSPFRIGNIEVKNRIEFSPSCTCLGSPDGYVTKELIAYYQAIARGGAGIITIGETPVDYKYAKRHEYQLNIGNEKIIAGLSVLVEAVHRYGAKLSIELNHGGGALINREEAIAPSPIPSKLEEMLAKMEGRKKIRVIEMTQDMIDEVIDNFARAAERCLKAGFEMIMIHGGHGHLLAQFLSPYSNKRTDAYGGSLENRARFALEVLTEIRKRVGNKLAIEYRISANELVPGGMQEDETIEFVKMIQDKIDLLHISSGILGDPNSSQYLIQLTYFPYCHNVHYAEKFKKELNIPVATVGSISNIQMAEKIISEGKADIVAMARAVIADPEIVNKARRGEVEEVRPCLRCNICTGNTRNNLPIRCTVNPIIGRELDYTDIKPAKKKKKVVIIGGGPAGIMAALTASRRGHEVVLFEKSDNLGGNLILAAGPSFKADMKNYLGWLIRQVQKDPNIKIITKCEVKIDIIKLEEPDAVIIATGSEPLIPDVPGKDRDNVVWVGDVHIDRVTVGETVIIVGGGLTGCEAALHLAQQGKTVTVIDMLTQKELAAGIPRGLMTLLNENGVHFLTGVKLEEIIENGVIVIDKSWRRIKVPADTVVLSLGFKPRREIPNSFIDRMSEAYTIGDCRKPKDLKQAIHDGFNVAVEI